MNENGSIYGTLEIPVQIGILLSTFAFILLLAPYFAGFDFGIFKVPELSIRAKKVWKIFGGPLFFISLVLFTPSSLMVSSSNSTIKNFGFERLAKDESRPVGWGTAAYNATSSFSADSTVSKSGARSARIEAPVANHARWIQQVPVDSNRIYILSGWVRTRGVEHTSETFDQGATFAISGEGLAGRSSAGLLGDNEWTYVSVHFNSGTATSVEVAAQLGTFGGQTSGEVWFDDLKLEKLEK